MADYNKLPFGPTTSGNPVSPKIKRMAKALLEIRDNLYEAQGQFVNGNRSDAAANIEVAMNRATLAREEEHLTSGEATDIRGRLWTLRSEVLREDDREAVVRHIKEERSRWLEKVLDKIV